MVFRISEHLPLVFVAVCAILLIVQPPPMRAFFMEVRGGQEIAVLPYTPDRNAPKYCGPYFLGSKGPYRSTDRVDFAAGQSLPFFLTPDFGAVSVVKSNIEITIDDSLYVPYVFLKNGSELSVEIRLSEFDLKNAECLTYRK